MKWQSKYFHNSVISNFFILLNLLRWYWLIKLYRFQVYNSIIHYLNIVLCVHHSKPSLLPSPFIPSLPFLSSLHLPIPLEITILLSVSSRVFFLCLILSSFLPSPQHPFPSDSHFLFSVSMSLFLFCLLVYFVH